MITLVVTAYGMVLVAELVGDKTLYTLGALASRYRLLPILTGALLAFVLKMLVAVLVGRFIARLPGALVAAMSAATFLAMGLGLWLKKPSDRPAPREATRWTRAALVSFSAIFFPEWGDPGQIAAAMLVAQHDKPFAVWLGATLAMLTKACLAVTLGIGLRRFLPRDTLRVVTVAVCVTMGLLAALRVEI